MEVWTFATQKGGAGKTTLATNLAVRASAEGQKTLIIDLDPQESASKWWERREAENPQLVKIRPNDLEQALSMAKEQQYTQIFIDTAGHETLKHNNAILLSTFCIVPCQPSVADIEAVHR